MKARGFSLVELLLVISILMALIAMILPALNLAKEAARQVNCISNLSQMGKAHTNYASEHDDRWLDGAVQDDVNFSAYSVWGNNWALRRSQDRYRGHGALYQLKLVTDSRIFYCPSWTHRDAQWGSCANGANQNGWPSDDDPAGCGTNRIWTSYHYRTTRASPKFRSIRVSDPASAAVMADAFSDPSRGINLHHGVGYSALFHDGHASFLNDRSKTVENKNGGSAYDSSSAGHQMQEQVWIEFFDAK